MNLGIMDELALCANKLGKVIEKHGKFNIHLAKALKSLAAFGAEQLTAMAKGGTLKEPGEGHPQALKPGRKAAKTTPRAAEVKPERKKPGPKPRKEAAPKAPAKAKRTGRTDKAEAKRTGRTDKAEAKRTGRTDKAEAAPAAGRTTMGVCIICGKSYLRRSNVQKTCSPECLEKKRAGLDAHGEPLNDGATQP
jgi:hypothetical protein